MTSGLIWAAYCEAQTSLPIVTALLVPGSGNPHLGVERDSPGQLPLAGNLEPGELPVRKEGLAEARSHRKW